MDEAISRLPPFLRRNLDSVRNHVHALAGYRPACEISHDRLAVGYPGSRIARDSCERRTSPAVACDERPRGRSEFRRLAQASRRQACRATFLQPPPEMRAGGHGRRKSSHSFVCFAVARTRCRDTITGRHPCAARPDSVPRAAGSAGPPQAPPCPSPAFCSRGVARAVSPRPRGRQASGQSARLLLGAAEGLRQVRRKNHDDPRSRASDLGRTSAVMTMKAPPPPAAGMRQRRT